MAFAGAESQRALFEGRGFRFHALSTRLATRGVSRFDSHPAMSWANPDHSGALAALCDTAAPQRLIIDCMMFGALAGAEAAGMAATVLAHSAPNALLPPGGSLERMLLPAVNALRQGLGLAPLTSLQDAWAPFRILVASIPELDPPGHETGLDFTYAGPFSPADTSDAARWRCDGDRPLVLVSFSTGSAWDQSSRIARTAAALSGVPGRVLFTTAQAEIGNVARPANAIFLPYAPHRHILPHVKAVVTHAGHGTVCAALAAGAPMVCLPNRGVDQEALAERVAALGAGIALDGDTATPEQIRVAVDRVMGEAAFRQAAWRLSERIELVSRSGMSLLG